jgi:hypothetical protein
MIARLLPDDAWRGTDEERYAAVNEVLKLLDALGDPTKIGDCNDMGCCNEALTKYRINSDGSVDISTDGGETYHDLPTFGNPLDPGTTFPPITGADVAAIRCKAANSVTGWFQLLQRQQHEALVAEVNELAIAAILEGALLLIGIGTFTVWAAVGTTIALLVAQKNADDFEAEFTEPFWNKLCERAYCDVDAIGVYLNTDPRQIIDEVTADSPGYAANWLNAALGTFTGAGLTNMAAAGFDAGISCDEFSCSECADLDFHIAAGTLVSQDLDEDGNCVLVVDSQFTGSHHDVQIYWNVTNAPVLTHNAHVLDVETTPIPIGSAAHTVGAYFWRPATNDLVASSSGGKDCGTGLLYEAISTGDGEAFTATITVRLSNSDCTADE